MTDRNALGDALTVPALIDDIRGILNRYTVNAATAKQLRLAIKTLRRDDHDAATILRLATDYLSTAQSLATNHAISRETTSVLLAARRMSHA